MHVSAVKHSSHAPRSSALPGTRGPAGGPALDASRLCSPAWGVTREEQSAFWQHRREQHSRSACTHTGRRGPRAHRPLLRPRRFDSVGTHGGGGRTWPGTTGSVERDLKNYRAAGRWPSGGSGVGQDAGESDAGGSGAGVHVDGGKRGFGRGGGLQRIAPSAAVPARACAHAQRLHGRHPCSGGAGRPRAGMRTGPLARAATQPAPGPATHAARAGGADTRRARYRLANPARLPLPAAR